MCAVMDRETWRLVMMNAQLPLVLRIPLELLMAMPLVAFVHERDALGWRSLIDRMAQAPAAARLRLGVYGCYQPVVVACSRWSAGRAMVRIRMRAGRVLGHPDRSIA